MKIFSSSLTRLMASFLAMVCVSISTAKAQAPSNRLPSDSSLYALVNKHIKTPIKRVVQPNGDVFLQRDFSKFLHAMPGHAEVPPGQADKGHDHKSDQLEVFLNRPHPSVLTMDKYFKEAAREFNVPVEILKVYGQQQSNWAQVSESMYGSWGVMGLIEMDYNRQISLAAKLINSSTHKIQSEARENIRAAAALLAHYQQGQPSSNKLEDWFLAVRQLTGYQDGEMRTSFAQQVFSVMKEGSKTITNWGEIIFIAPVQVQVPSLPFKEESEAGGQVAANGAPDYSKAILNLTTCNFNARPNPSNINFYFVHYIATGTYAGAISWFKNCSSSASSHYVVRNNDGQITQVVYESDRAWTQGVSLYNDQGIGVEHEVLSTNLAMWDNPIMLQEAGRLCADVCGRRAIPKTRRVTNGDKGIYGHSDVRATDCPNMTQARWDAFLGQVNNAGPTVALPTLYSVLSKPSTDSVFVSWKASTDANLVGYRLYYATNDALTSWALAANETTLTATTTQASLKPSMFVVPPSTPVFHFRIAAVVSNGSNPNVEGAPSDVYSRSSNATGAKVLIVDGFDRTSGSWKNPTHSFTAAYFKALRDRGVVQISSVDNDRIDDGTFDLKQYDIVLWYVGDESSVNVVFTTNEKNQIKSFLEAGKKLIVTGAEIAYNMGRTGAAALDLPFFNGYLKATYVGDGASNYSPASGTGGIGFDGLVVNFGIVYPEDFPDDIAATGGSVVIQNYAVSGKRGAVAYKGNFGSSTTPGALIYLAYTLETAEEADMGAFMQRALTYFQTAAAPVAPVVVDDNQSAVSGLDKKIYVLSNDYIISGAIDSSTLVIVGNPQNGSAKVLSDGTILYRSNASYVGADQFTYRVSSKTGLLSNTGSVAINVVLATGCVAIRPELDENAPLREMRGAWVTSVSNLDWPSSRSLSSAQQQAELLALLDSLRSAGINSVFLQVRPECDALYNSPFEPWSYWLTGTQGQAPSPLWDPLTFATQEAHKRGMDLHAWINPYRAKQSTPTLASNNIAVQQPGWTFSSGSLTMLNPGIPMVRDHITKIVADIATRYDVDGIHFDDYFYPYSGMAGQDLASFNLYSPGSPLSDTANWRRNNVNQLVARVYDTLQLINTNLKKNVVFGISPFGIWKSGTPAGIIGSSSFSSFYCDPIAWLQAGKVDYLAPQLYWRITGPQDYNALSKWWNDQCADNGKYCFGGLALYRLTDASNWDVSEILNQIKLNRDAARNQVLGEIMFRAKNIQEDAKSIKSSLQKGLYQYRSYAPAYSWKDAVCPNPPQNVSLGLDSILRWKASAAAADGDITERYVVYRFDSVAQMQSNRFNGAKVIEITGADSLYVGKYPVGSVFVIGGLDKNNNESQFSEFALLSFSGFEFTATKNGASALLNWSTQTEKNLSHFEVQKSVDEGLNFLPIKQVPAMGNSNQIQRYTHLDAPLVVGRNIYRIKIVDKEGKSTFSSWRIVNGDLIVDQIKVYPNPFATQVVLQHASKVKEFRLSDMSGKLLMKQAINQNPGSSNQTVVLNLSSLQAGIYVLTLYKSDGEQESIQLIKQ